LRTSACVPASQLLIAASIFTHGILAIHRLVRIQVKGRNPDKMTSCRWFQIRVSKRKLERSRRDGVETDQTWRKEVSKADFFVLAAARIGEMWVLSQGQLLDLVRYSESKYARRPDNRFAYGYPIKAKQKEMNLDIEVDGTVLTERFRDCFDNFERGVKCGRLRPFPTLAVVSRRILIDPRMEAR
jgi:hypothetical protein